MMKTPAVLRLCLLLACVVPAAAAPLFETTTVHETTPKNRPNYRIPAIMTAPNGDVLVFTEKRNSGIGDLGNHDLVLRRSSDHGRTWGKEELIYDDGEDTCTDTTLCLDRERGRIFVFFLKNKKRYAYLSSDDNGRTWRGPVDIHDQVTKPEWETVGLHGKTDVESSSDPESAKTHRNTLWKRNWMQRYGVGPGNSGVQLTQGPKKGRLVIPARHLEDGPGRSRLGFSHVFYSDDHGETWTLGPNVAPQGNECRLEELADGTLMMSARNATHEDFTDNARRLVAISRDGGETWPVLYRDDALVSTTVHAGFRRYDRPGSPDDGLLLFSNPASPIRQKEHPYGRYNMTVRWSRDNGQTWSAGRIIYPHPSSYSDLTVLADGSIGIVYERGPKDSVKYWDEIQFARFNLEWLFAPPHTVLRK